MAWLTYVGFLFVLISILKPLAAWLNDRDFWSQHEASAALKEEGTGNEGQPTGK